MRVLDLSRTQAWFATAVMTGATVDDGVAIAGGSVPLERVEDVVAPSPRMNARERLGVYHHAYRARLIECLADDYPALRQALGQERFEELCQQYIAAHPSRSFSLNFFGANLPAFCGGREEPWSQFGSDLAQLEWAIVEAVHAPWTARSPRLSQVAGDWNERRLLASATLRVVRSDYPVNAYYQAFREAEEAAPELPAPARTVTAVTRNDMTVWRTNIPVPLIGVLDALVAGSTLGAALEIASASETEIATAFRDWVSTGMFVDVE